MIEFTQGKTEFLDLEIVTKAGDPVPLETADVICVVDKQGKQVEKTFTKSGNILTIKFDPSQTYGMKGIYDIEVKIRDTNGDVDLVFSDVIKVNESLIKNFI